MKNRIFQVLPALLGLALVALVQSLRAGLPQPMCVFYGQACDGYGQPYRTNAEVILRHGTNEIARQVIGGSLSPGVNFALYVHLDDGRTASPYSARALRSGDLVSIVVRDADGEKTIMEKQAVPPVGQPGELVLINATAADDSDHDGLPDQWEYEIIAWSNGTLLTLADVHPEDDFDEDGMANLQEYRAGTFAFLTDDSLRIDMLSITPAHRLQLVFLSVPGKIYRPMRATDPSQSSWEPCAFALSDSGPFQLTPAEGDGDWFSLYVEVNESAQFFRLEAR